jgi:DNA mismatch endonuclease (patch repair protein)
VARRSLPILPSPPSSVQARQSERCVVMGKRCRPTRTPSFAGLAPSSCASSHAKRANRATDTRAEVSLRSALWCMGARFRKNVSRLPGKPDVVFAGPRVVVFCDGDFWHGRNWRVLRAKLRGGANADYWIRKISANIARDRRTDRALRKAGWLVIRLWETDILANPETAARRLCLAVVSRSSGTSRPVARESAASRQANRVSPAARTSGR